MFWFLSFLLNIFLIFIIVSVFKINKIKITKKEFKVIATAIIFLYVFYIINILTRKFIYYWDFACYYQIQIRTIDCFKQSLFSGIHYFISSTWGGEYGNFLCFIPQVLFGLTNKVPNDYVFSCAITFIPYLLITYAGLLKSLKVKHFNIGIFIFTLFPLLHSQLILGQPDLFGLTFIFLLLILASNYNFSKKDYIRYALFTIITFMLLISRRWYLYWILFFYICYVLYLVVKNIKDKKKLITIIKNGLILVLIMSSFFLITLFPFFRNVLLNNYASRYSAFYSAGGFFADMLLQINRLGIVTVLIVLIGMIYGLINKKTRLVSILSIIQYLLIVFLFTRTQSLGLHHSLILLPVYILFIYLFVEFISTKKINKILIIVFILLYSFNFIYGLNLDKNTRVFTQIDLRVHDEVNYDEYGKIVDWLYDNLGEEYLYMIDHTEMFNPDKIRNYKMPDTYLSEHVYYGSAIVGTHKFPIELLTSKYVMVSDPFVPISMNEYYYKVFSEISEEKFRLVKTFKMEDGYVLNLYERIEEVDREECEKYLEVLTDYSKKYPDLYSDVFENFIKEHNL